MCIIHYIDANNMVVSFFIGFLYICNCRYVLLCIIRRDSVQCERNNYKINNIFSLFFANVYRRPIYRLFTLFEKEKSKV